MAYTKKNQLLRIQQVIATYLEHKQDGNTTAWVYRNHIYPRYHISLATLYNYLATPVDRMLKEADKKKAEQMKLF
jgi:hypothetical protein